MLRPVELCQVHRIEVAAAVVPEVLREQLVGALRGTLAIPTARTELVAAARAVPLDDLRGVHDSVVYFIANGGRVKIGYTTNLKSRLGSLALRRDSVLLALGGGPDLERALHAHFSGYRSGNTEWFELAPEIFRFIASPHPAVESVAQAAGDQLAAKAREDFAGETPSVRRLRETYSIGQARAQRLRDELAGVARIA